MCAKAMVVRPATANDIDAVAAIHGDTFTRQGESVAWLACHMRAWPLSRVFAAAEAGKIVGYAIWAEKSGFRPAAVIELVQIAVASSHRGTGIGTALIRDSLDQVRAAIAEQGRALSSIMVTTADDNRARALYRRALGVKSVAEIVGIFAQPEIVMVGPAQ